MGLREIPARLWVSPLLGKEVRKGQYQDMKDMAKKYVDVQKAGPIHKFADKHGQPLPVALSISVPKDDKEPSFLDGLWSSGAGLECALSGSDDDESDGCTSTARKTTKKAPSSTPRKGSPKKLPRTNVLPDKDLRKILFQVWGCIDFHITARQVPSLGRRRPSPWLPRVPGSNRSW